MPLQTAFRFDAGSTLYGMVVTPTTQSAGIFLKSPYDQAQSLSRIGEFISQYFTKEGFTAKLEEPESFNGRKPDLKYHCIKEKHLFIPVFAYGPEVFTASEREDFPVTMGRGYEKFSMHFNAKDKDWARKYRDECITDMVMNAGARRPGARF